jgi:hypothetical protein
VTASGRRGGSRPRWATCLSLFCALTLVFLVSRDLFVPEVRDTEVWLGLELHGRLAWITAPLHWLLFAVGAWAYATLRPWVWPWASVYVLYVAFSHLVWNLTSPSGGGWAPGLWQLLGLTLAAVALLWARPPAPQEECDGAP